MYLQIITLAFSVLYFYSILISFSLFLDIYFFNPLGYQRVNKIRFLYGVLSEGCLINVLRKLFIVKFLGQNIGVKHNKELLANIT